MAKPAPEHPTPDAPNPQKSALRAALRWVLAQVPRCRATYRSWPANQRRQASTAIALLLTAAVAALMLASTHRSTLGGSLSGAAGGASGQIAKKKAGTKSVAPPYSLTSAMGDIANHRVRAATIDDTKRQVRLSLITPPPGNNSSSSVPSAAPSAAAASAAGNGEASQTLQVPVDYMATLEQALINANVEVSVSKASPVAGAAAGQGGPNFGFLVLMLSFAAVFGIMLFRRKRRMEAASGEPGNHRPGVVQIPQTRFSDVAGCDEAIEELKELVLFLNEPERFTRTGAKAPKGALLCGPPGTGKTLLARAVAGEAGVPMFVAAGSDFSEKYVGVGAQRVRQLFAEARKHPRAIVFIDEIDAAARSRSEGGNGSGAEHDQTLVALLAEMDGFRTSNVIVLAATNRPDVLDSALTRPGRLDRRIEVPNADRRGRQRILEVHTATKPVAEDVDLLALARRTPGFSGAQLASLVNEACIDAVRRNLELVDQSCFDHAVATIAMGRARTSALVTEHDRQITAWHESGHAVAAYLQPDADDPVQVTIVPRGAAGGVTWMSGNDNAFLPRKAALAQLVTALAGRAAEEVLLDGEYTQGASGDLMNATNLAYQMATEYGMTKLGYRVHQQQAAVASQSVADVVEDLLAEAYLGAVTLLSEHPEFLAAVAGQLLDEDTLTLADMQELAVRSGVRGHAQLAVSAPARGRPIGAVIDAETELPPRSPAPAPRRVRPSVAAAVLLRRVRGQSVDSGTQRHKWPLKSAMRLRETAARR